MVHLTESPTEEKEEEETEVEAAVNELEKQLHRTKFENLGSLQSV